MSMPQAPRERGLQIVQMLQFFVQDPARMEPVQAISPAVEIFQPLFESAAYQLPHVRCGFLDLAAARK